MTTETSRMGPLSVTVKNWNRNWWFMASGGARVEVVPDEHANAVRFYQSLIRNNGYPLGQWAVKWATKKLAAS